MALFPLQNPKEKDKKFIKTEPQNMYYKVHCMFVGKYFSDFEFFLLKLLKKYYVTDGNIMYLKDACSVPIGLIFYRERAS
jgi:hypothetical protein